MAKIGRHKRYEIFRDYLKHEDSLINWRITWNLATQGFLFAAYGAASARTGNSELLELLVSRVLPPFGMAMSIVALMGILAAHRAIQKLVSDWWDIQRGYEKTSAGRVLPLLPALAGGGDKAARLRGYVSSVGTPVVVIAAWVTISVMHGSWAIIWGVAALLVTTSLVAPFVQEAIRAEDKRAAGADHTVAVASTAPDGS